MDNSYRKAQSCSISGKSGTIRIPLTDTMLLDLLKPTKIVFRNRKTQARFEYIAERDPKRFERQNERIDNGFIKHQGRSL